MRIDVDFCKRIERAEARGLRGAIEHGRTAFPDRDLLVTEIGGATVCFAGADSPFSQTLGVGIDTEFSGRDVEAIVEFYHSRATSARVYTSPVAGEALSSEFARRGFEVEEYVALLAANLTEVTGQRDARIDVCNDEQLWANRSALAFNDGKAVPEPMLLIGRIMASHPTVTPLALHENGQIVTTGCMALEDDGIAAFFATSTMPQARGRGYQAAMIGDRIARAREAGALIVRAGAKPGSASERNFRRAGFEVLYTQTVWILRPPVA